MIPRSRGREAPKSAGVAGKITSFSSEPVPPNLLEIKITEVVDLTTFWAQIGTGRFFLLSRAQCIFLGETFESGRFQI